MAKKRKPAKPRDPTWRARRALRPKRIDSAKAYDRRRGKHIARDEDRGESEEPE